MMAKWSVLACFVLMGWATLPCSAEDDDGVMGIWEGKFTSPGWESKILKAKIWGVRTGMWDGKLTVFDGENAVGEGKIADSTQDKNFSFEGSITLDGEYVISATAIDGKMTGELSPGRETKKGGIKPNKKGGVPIAFAMERVHVKPPSLGAAPPEGAVVLLGAGKDLSEWNVPPAWQLGGDGGMHKTDSSIVSKQEFGSCKMHVEFKTRYMPNEPVGSQARCNSGVYVQGRYEIQVLDSFGATPLNNLCGGIYKIATPLADAVLPPETIQTYDIEFHAPKFDASGKKTQEAELTVLHNGIVIHDHLKLPNVTPGGVSDVEGPTGPLMLQNHHDVVDYYNTWIEPIQD